MSRRTLKVALSSEQLIRHLSRMILDDCSPEYLEIWLENQLLLHRAVALGECADIVMEGDGMEPDGGRLAVVLSRMGIGALIRAVHHDTLRNAADAIKELKQELLDA